MNDSFFSTGEGAVVKAVLILAFAFIIAAVVRSLMVKLFTKTKLCVLLKSPKAPAGDSGKAEDFIGKLTYLLVFLLFVPGIFESLGMGGMSAPILNLLDTVWGYLPNLLAAVIVLWVGIFIARLVRELLVPVFDKMKVNRLQEMAGLEVADSAKLSNTLAYIVYVLILLPVIITALQVLDIRAISEPAIKMLDIIFGFIPNILVALIILIIGCMVARLSGNIVENLIASAGIDLKLSRLIDNENRPIILSRIAGRTVQTVMVIFFIVESFGVLHLQVLTDIGNAIIGYMPYILAAALILIACSVCNSMIQKALNKNGYAAYAIFCKCAVYTIGGFMILNELGIATEIVNTVFILMVAAAAVAFALAFGVGGRSYAERMLKKFEDQFDGKHK